MQKLEDTARRSASRRNVLGLAAGAVLLGGLCAGAGQAVADAAKASQKSVDYQDHPKAGKGCNSCTAFLPPTKCKTVEGFVQASGWCSQYKKIG